MATNKQTNTSNHKQLTQGPATAQALALNAVHAVATTAAALAPSTAPAAVLQPSTQPLANYTIAGVPSTAKQATNGIGPAPKQGTVGHAAIACIAAGGATMAQKRAKSARVLGVVAQVVHRGCAYLPVGMHLAIQLAMPTNPFAALTAALNGAVSVACATCRNPNCRTSMAYRHYGQCYFALPVGTQAALVRVSSAFAQGCPNAGTAQYSTMQARVNAMQVYLAYAPTGTMGTVSASTVAATVVGRY